MDAIEKRNDRMLRALAAVEPLLTGAADGGAPAFVADYRARKRQAEEAREPKARALALGEVAALVQTHGAARELLKQEMEKRECLGPYLEAELAQFAAAQGLAAGGVAASVEALVRAMDLAARSAGKAERKIQLPPLEGGQAKSIKISNFRLEKLPELAAEGALTAHEVAEAGPLLIAAGAILVLLRLRSAFTQTLDNRQASVLWGILETAGEGGFAREADIERAANDARARAGLAKLAPGQTATALEGLRQWGCLERRGGADPEWRAVEPIEMSE